MIFSWDAQVKVVSDPREWEVSAQNLQLKRDEYKRAVDAQVRAFFSPTRYAAKYWTCKCLTLLRVQRRLRKRAAAELSNALPEKGVLTPYEQRRADNMARNDRVLAAMRLTPTKAERKISLVQA